MSVSVVAAYVSLHRFGDRKCEDLLFPICNYRRHGHRASAQTPYYQADTHYTGSQTGAVSNLRAMIATHIGKHIPAILTPSCGTAGGPYRGGEYVYRVANPTLTLLAPNPNLYVDQLIGRSEIKFDWAKFSWLGNAQRTTDMLYMRTDAPFKTMEDVRSAKEPPKCGATGTGTTGFMVPRLLEETIGAKFTVITGYKGGNEVDLAVERGEVQCRAFSVTAFFAREPFHTWRKLVSLAPSSSSVKVGIAGCPTW